MTRTKHQLLALVALGGTAIIGLRCYPSNTTWKHMVSWFVCMAVIMVIEVIVISLTAPMPKKVAVEQEPKQPKQPEQFEQPKQPEQPEPDLSEAMPLPGEDVLADVHKRVERMCLDPMTKVTPLRLDPHKLLTSKLPVVELQDDPDPNDLIAYGGKFPEGFIVMTEICYPTHVQTPCIVVVKNGVASITYRRPDPIKKEFKGLSPWDERHAKAIAALGPF